MDFNKLTIKAQEAIAAAQELARKRENPEIHPEHLAIALGLRPDEAFLVAVKRILPSIAALLPRAVPFPPQLVPATFIDDAPLLGALALAVEAVGVS